MITNFLVPRSKYLTYEGTYPRFVKGYTPKEFDCVTLHGHYNLFTKAQKDSAVFGVLIKDRKWGSYNKDTNIRYRILGPGRRMKFKGAKPGAVYVWDGNAIVEGNGTKDSGNPVIGYGMYHDIIYLTYNSLNTDKEHLQGMFPNKPYTPEYKGIADEQYSDNLTNSHGLTDGIGLV